MVLSALVELTASLMMRVITALGRFKSSGLSAMSSPSGLHLSTCFSLRTVPDRDCAILRTIVDLVLNNRHDGLVLTGRSSLLACSFQKLLKPAGPVSTSWSGICSWIYRSHGTRYGRAARVILPTGKLEN